MADRAATPSQGGEGSDIRSATNAIAGLLDDSGQFNPNPDQLSRAHPDYDPDADPRNQSDAGGTPDRDERGRFRARNPVDDESEDEQLNADAQETSEAEDDLPDDEVDDADTDDEHVDARSQDDAEETGDTDDEDDAITTLSGLAEALEMPLDELSTQLTHTFKAAGQEVTATLQDLVAGFQMKADYDRDKGALANQRRDFEFEMQQRGQMLDQEHYVAASGMQAMQQLLQAQLNSPKLEALREVDQSEWLAQRKEIEDQLGWLGQVTQQAAATYNQNRQQNLAALRQREEQTLLEAVPDFGDQHRQLVRDTMTSLGYSPAEQSQVFDNRLVRGALELAALRAKVAELEKAQTTAQETVKRVKKEVPKLQKPGRSLRNRGKGIDRDRAGKLNKRLRQSGKVEDAALVIENMMQ